MVRVALNLSAHLLHLRLLRAPPPAADLGFGRMSFQKKEAPNMLVNMV